MSTKKHAGLAINMRQFKKWIRGLDSGKYAQTQGELENSDGYCCLGVACVLTIPKSKIIIVDDYLMGGLPKEKKYAPKWLKRINSHFKQKTRINLTTLNDDEDFTFSEIATLLELVYIHKMLG